MMREKEIPFQLNGVPEGLSPKNNEVIQTPFSELNIFITGGNRDIGKATIDAALENGAQHIASTFRRGSQRKKNVEPFRAAAQETYGVDVSFTQCDLTTEEGINAVFKVWEEKFDNKVDILGLNTSGQGAEINVIAAQKLTDRFLQLRRERKEKGEKLPRGKIVLMQSIPGLLHDRIDGAVDFTDIYKNVGPYKLKGQRALEARKQELEELDIDLIIVCPPEVPETLNMEAFEKMDPHVRQKSRDLSDMVGLPRTVSTPDVGQKVIELAKQDNLKSGHLELFSETQDAYPLLSKMYGDNAIYLTTFNTQEKKAWAIVNPPIHEPNLEYAFLGPVTNRQVGHISTALHVLQDSMRGHFKKETGIKVFPGHKSMRTIINAISQYNDSNSPLSARLLQYDFVTFDKPITPNTTLYTEVDIRGMDEHQRTYADAKIYTNGQQSVEMSGIVCETIEPEDHNDILLEDQLIEAAAQAFGSIILQGKEKQDVVPLFQGTGPGIFHTRAQKGDSLVFYVDNIQEGKSTFEGDVRVMRQNFVTDGDKRVIVEEEIARIQKLKGLILPRKIAERMLKQAA